MSIKTFVLLTAAALGIAALGCTTETTVVTPDQQSPGVTVSGTGSVFGEPDVAVLSLGVSAQAQSVGEARTQAAGAMNAMLDALKQGGIAEKDIQTARLSVQPMYDYIDGKQVLRGFSVDNTVIAKLRSIDDTGTVIDAALAAGGNLARIDSLQFTIDDPTSLEDQARTKAMADAGRKAGTLAEAGGVKLGNPRSISEGGGVQPVPFAGAELAAVHGEAAQTPIQLGELEVRIDVQVAYELK